jgi:hypothetical protein
MFYRAEVRNSLNRGRLDVAGTAVSPLVRHLDERRSLLRLMMQQGEDTEDAQIFDLEDVFSGVRRAVGTYSDQAKQQ